MSVASSMQCENFESLGKFLSPLLTKFPNIIDGEKVNYNFKTRHEAYLNLEFIEYDALLQLSAILLSQNAASS